MTGVRVLVVCESTRTAAPRGRYGQVTSSAVSPQSVAKLPTGDPGQSLKGVKCVFLSAQPTPAHAEAVQPDCAAVFRPLPGAKHFDFQPCFAPGNEQKRV